MAGFCELATSLRAPILGILGAKWPIVSGGHLKNSRFWEIAPGDRVRSALRGRGYSAKAQNLWDNRQLIENLKSTLPRSWAHDGP
jgi:hypothetical protein